MNDRNSTKIKVSILLPCFNAKPYIVQCLDSILRQTLKEIEILCGDGGSTDGTLEILSEYALKDTRIQVFAHKGWGYGRSMNDCFRHATGEYVGIVESDDFIDPKMFATLYEKAKDIRADIVKSDFYCFREEKGKLRKWKVKIGLNSFFYHKIFEPRQTTSAFRCCLQTWCGIYRRNFLTQHKIFHHESEGGSFQDNGFWFQTFAYAKIVYFMPKAFYYYRQDNPKSSIHNPDKVMDICEEYNFIKRVITEKKGDLQSLDADYWVAKLGAYLYTLERVHQRHRLVFLQQMQRDFQLVNVSKMNQREKKIVEKICTSPERYLKEKNQKENARGVFLLYQKIVGFYWCVKEHGLGYSLARMRNQ